MKKHTLISSTGNKLALLINVLPQEMNYIVIACHGFLGGKENRGWINYLKSELEKINIGLVAFDFEGCGESEGDFADITLSRQALNLNDVIDYVRLEFAKPLILLGRSFGGSTILVGGSNHEDVQGYVLWATPVFLPETFSKIMPGVYEKLQKGEKITYEDNGQIVSLNPNLVADFVNHDMDNHLENIKDKPVLIIHGDSDQVVEPSNAHYILSKNQAAKLHIVNGADHGFTGHEKHRIDLTILWLASRFA